MGNRPQRYKKSREHCSALNLMIFKWTQEITLQHNKKGQICYLRLLVTNRCNTRLCTRTLTFYKYHKITNAAVILDGALLHLVLSYLWFRNNLFLGAQI